jgi:polyisoprenoid-binding protein YceI
MLQRSCVHERARALQPSRVRSAFAPIVPPLAALVASLVRWLVQGSGNIYTAFHKRFYVPDPDVGWVESTRHPIWLGLEACAVIAAFAVAVAVGCWIIRRREAKTGARATVLRPLAWTVGALPLILPIMAFASGGAPAGGVSLLPQTKAMPVAPPGIAGALALPAGRYDVAAHAATSISARISAGGEAFDAVFGKDITGTWQGNPRDLAQPMTAQVSVAAASVDTGIGERSDHARESYLQNAKYPRITFTLDKLDTARQDGAAQIAFTAQGTVGLIGKTHHVAVTGTLRQPDAAAQQRLGVTGDVLIVQADFALAIHETALAPDAKDFDGDRIPVHVSLVLRHTGGG